MGGSPAPTQYSVGGKIVYKNSMCNPCVFLTNQGQADTQREGHLPPTPSTGLHTGLVLALVERDDTMMDRSLAANSKRTYDRAWKMFQTFHQATFGRPGSLPVKPNVMAMFVAYMDKLGHTRTMVRTYALDLSHADKMADVKDPTTKCWVRKVMDTAGSHAKATPTRRPITMEIVGTIIMAAQMTMQ